MTKVKGRRTADDPWALETPLGSADFEAYRDEAAELEHNPKNNRIRAIAKKE